MAIIYYISAHGFGHAVRSSAIISKIPSEIPVIVRSNILPKLLSEIIERPFTLEPAEFDCGAIQKDGFTADGPATLARYSEIHLANSRRLKEEIQFLERNKGKLVVSDVASFPMVAAQSAGLPGIVVGNFTWVDIYEPFVEHQPSYRSLLDEMRAEYGMATACLKLPLSMPMADVPQAIDIPLVCRIGESIRPALAGWLDIDLDKKWALAYIGQYPVDFDWERLATYEDWQFLVIARDKPPHPSIAMIDPDRFHIPDIFASCDVLLGKPGYGTVADAIAADRSLAYALPTGFAEADLLDREITSWGRGVRIDRETLFKGDIRPALEQANQSTSKRVFPLNGAAIAAELLADAWRGKGVTAG